jgi:hypothetical protein
MDDTRQWSSSQQFPVILEKFITKISTYSKMFLKSNKKMSHIIRCLSPNRESLSSSTPELQGAKC